MHCQTNRSVRSPAVVILRWQVDPDRRQSDAVAAAVADLQGHTSQLERLLDPQGTFAIGHSLSLADAGYPAAFL